MDRRQQHMGMGKISAMIMHTLYVGNRNGVPFGDKDINDLIRCVLKSFESFTVLDGRGVFRGRSVPTTIVQIASDETAKVREVAVSLAGEFNQEAIGLEVGGWYSRVLSPTTA